MVVDASVPWYMGSQEEGNSLSNLVKDAIKVQSDAKEEVAFKQEIIQKCQPLSERMKTLLSSNVPSKKWTIEEGECQVSVSPECTYRFEFPYGSNVSRRAWLQIREDSAEGFFPRHIPSASVWFRTDSDKIFLSEKDNIDMVLATTELVL